MEKQIFAVFEMIIDRISKEPVLAYELLTSTQVATDMSRIFISVLMNSDEEKYGVLNILFAFSSQL